MTDNNRNDIIVTVCELPCEEKEEMENAWAKLVAHCHEQGSELLLLPEMAFSHWIFSEPSYLASSWQHAVQLHEHAIQSILPSSFSTLPISVISTRPVTCIGEDGTEKRFNEAFHWKSIPASDKNTSPTFTIESIYKKHYLPNEPCFWEANWYHSAINGGLDTSNITHKQAREQRQIFDNTNFNVSTIKVTRNRKEAKTEVDVRVGMQICSDMWFTNASRIIAEQNAHMILTPRSTGHSSISTWLSAAHSIATISACYALSSNRVAKKLEVERSALKEDATSNGQVDAGGVGWIISPVVCSNNNNDNDDTTQLQINSTTNAQSCYAHLPKVLGTTSKEHPFTTITIDLSLAETAKSNYPLYIPC